MNPREEIPRKEFAARLGVSVGTLDRWRREGLLGVRLIPVRRGGRVRYTWTGYQAWQEEVERRKRPMPAVGARERARRARAAEAAWRRHGLRPCAETSRGGPCA